MKKTDKYLKDFIDTFGEKFSQKDSMTFIKKIKKSQIAAYPSKQYKEKLWKKLENNYLESQSFDIPPRLSIFQFFGILGSFCFVFLTLFGVYLFYNDASYMMRYQEGEEILSPSEREFSGSEVGDDKIINSQDNKSEVLHRKAMNQSIPMGNDVFEEQNISQPNIQGGSNHDLQVFPEDISSFLMDEFLPEDMIENDVNIQDETSEYDESMEMDASMMMQAENSQSIYEIQMQEFYRICQENDGIVLDDDYTCEFETGEACNVDNITPESYKPCDYLYGNEKEE